MAEEFEAFLEEEGMTEQEFFEEIAHVFFFAGVLSALHAFVQQKQTAKDEFLIRGVDVQEDRQTLVDPDSCQILSIVALFYQLHQQQTTQKSQH